MSKHIAGKSSIYQTDKTNTNFFIGRVVSNTDSADGNRIKVRIKGVDDHIGNDINLVWCNPMIPKFINIVPKIGETVFVIVPNSANNYENRVYIGPIISQPQKLEKDPHFYTSRSLFDNGFTEPDQAPSTIPNAKGIYPKTEDIALQGRKNTDIIFKENQILLRAGKSELTNNLAFNKINPSYIQLNFNAELDKDGNRGSVTNIVSDKINLLTHSGGTPNYQLADQTQMISDDELKKIIETAHPLAFGDELVNFLNLVKEFIASHIHPYNGLPADKNKNVQDILNYDLNRLLSNNIKIN